MSTGVLLPLLVAMLSFVFATMLADQWWRRRRPYQLVWAVGMVIYGIAALTEVLGSAGTWDTVLYRAWYLTGAIWVAAWLGLGTVLLLGKTRFGYAFALTVFLAGLFTLLTQRARDYPDAGIAPWLYFGIAALVALAVAVLNYFADDRWPRLVAITLTLGTLASLVLMAAAPLPGQGYSITEATGIPNAEPLPGYIRLLTPFFNITGALSLVFGAIFSTYMFMPKRRLLHYSLDPNQKGDEFLFNLAISIVAFPVNLAVSLPGALRALVAGQLHSRVPATILIAIGGLVPSVTSGLSRFGETRVFDIGLFVGVLFLFAGFLVSIEVFHDLRVPFTGVTLWHRAPEPAEPLTGGR